MSWFQSARNFLARHGESARAAARHVLSAAVPGGTVPAAIWFGCWPTSSRRRHSEV